MCVTDSSNRRRLEYDKSIVLPAEGDGSKTFNLAMNDPNGQWIIDIEDVASGVTGRQRIQINQFIGAAPLGYRSGALYNRIEP